MRISIAITLFTIPTVLISLLGGSFWPFFSYELYVLPAVKSETFEVWGEKKESSERFKINSEWILWPVGPNGINQKSKQLLQSGKKDQDFKIILRYFYKRYQRASKKPHANLPEISKILIMQTKKNTENKFQNEETVLIERFSYDVKE